MLVGLHVLIFNLLLPHLTPVESTLVLLAIDILIVAVTGYLAAKSSPDSIEEEAKIVRIQAGWRK